MPNNLIPEVVSILDSNNVPFTILLKMDLTDTSVSGLPEEIVRLNISSKDVYWAEDGGTEYAYQGTGEFGSIGTVEQSVDLASYTIDATLTGINLVNANELLTTALQARYKNKPAWIYLAILDEDYTVVADSAGEGPLLLFGGRVEALNVSYSGSDASISARIGSKLQNWETPKGGNFSNGYQRNYIDSTDKGFEYMRQMSSIDLAFGAAGPRTKLVRDPE